MVLVWEDHSANIIMTEWKKCVAVKLINDDVIKFYAKNVNDTLLVVKK